MQVYPAIDVKGGRVVRWTGVGAEVVYAPDPVAIALGYLAQGARWLHLVDLDRAFGTGRDNDAALRRMAALPGARVQVGGLIGDAAAAERAIALGATRVTLSTAAAANQALLETVVRRVGAERLAVTIDVRDGVVVARGSTTPLPVTPSAIARRATALGIMTLVFRDLGRDGGLAGPDVAGAVGLVSSGAAVIVSGGVASATHITQARAAGLSGAIVGRALHEGVLTLAEAMACLR